jgi:hypothetical protein
MPTLRPAHHRPVLREARARERERQATYYQAHRTERLAYQKAYDARQRARREAT